MITPVLFYWAHRKGWVWAEGLRETYPQRGDTLEHEDDGPIPLPEGLALTHIWVNQLPPTFDHASFFKPGRWHGVLVYTDTKTAEWLKTEADRVNNFAREVKKLLLDPTGLYLPYVDD